MNKFAFTILGIAFNLFSNAQTNSIEGWYKATVVYSCPSYVEPTQGNRFNNLPVWHNGTTAIYSLKVEVESNKVITIDFGNGGSVHSGYNNEGYNYSGGNIFFKRDSEGNITSATTTVTINENGQTCKFEISIE